MFAVRLAGLTLMLLVAVGPLFGQEKGFLLLKNSNGRIAGKLLERDFKDPESGKSWIVIETESGGRMSFERSEATWQPADELTTRYAEELAKTTLDAAGHWRMAQWCLAEKGGRSRLGAQIDYHLLETVQLDPQHAEARKELERREWKNVGGRWIPEAQFYTNFGLLYENGRWVSQVQSRVNQILAERDAQVGQLKSQLAKWKQQLPRYDEAQAITQLRAISTELSIPLLDKEAQDEKLNEAPLRRIFLEVIGQIPCSTAQDSLIRFYLTDTDLGIKERARDLLLSPSFDSEQVTRFATSAKLIAAGALNPALDNERLQNHAAFLGELGTLNSILPLINAIETVHKVRVGGDPGRMQLQNSNVGRGMSFGDKPQFIEQKVLNQKVLNALRAITKANPGDSTDAWRRWYLDQYTLADYSVGADD